MGSPRKTKCVRIRLDFTLIFKDALDSLPAHKPEAIEDALAAWVRKMGLASAGAETLGPSNLKIDLDFRSVS